MKKFILCFLVVFLIGCGEEVIIDNQSSEPDEVIEEKTLVDTETDVVEEEIMLPGGEILFSSERGGDRDLYILDILTREERVVLDLPSIEGHGDFAPDGQRIVFFSNKDGNRELYTIDLRDTPLELKRLTEAEGDDHLPDWSPDGNWIVFESTRDGNSEIYIMSYDGSNQKRLTANSVKDKQPKFTSDGKKIVFTTIDKGKQKMASIRMKDVINEELPEATIHQQSDIGYVDFYGDMIAYHGNVESNPQIHVSDIELTEVKQLTSGRSFTHWVPVFSPDGKWLAYNKEKGFGTGDIYISTIDGEHETQLTYDPSSDWGPEWRPISSKKILFDSDRDGDREIYCYDSKTQEVIALTNNDSTDGIPYFSPDNEKILFFSNRDGDDEIYVMDVDGDNLIQLTENDTEDRAAAFAPNGKFIVFSSDRDGDREIFIMSPDGNNQKQLTINSDKDFWPSVSVDSRYVTYTHFSSTQDTYMIEVSDWENRTVFENILLSENCSRCSFSPDGNLIAYSTKINGAWQIAISHADGTYEHVLTDNYHDEWVPTWFDDDHLVFSRESGYKASIIKMNINDLSEEVLQESQSQNWRPITNN